MKAEELYKKDEDITAEGYIYKHTFELDGIRNNLGILGFTLVLPQNNALKALEMARKEEREKAIKVFREMTCKMGIDIPCERCSSTCVIYKFKELLNKEI